MRQRIGEDEDDEGQLFRRNARKYVSDELAFSPMRSYIWELGITRRRR